jgi:hypothetical protein
MTMHVAAAVFAFAAVQVWAVASAVGLGHSRLLTVVALAVLIFGVVPFARRFERQWHVLGRSALPSVGLHLRFRRDVRRLWIAALLVPVAWVGTVMLTGTAVAATF